MMKRIVLLLAALTYALPALAQRDFLTRDFLTNDEIEKVRVAQEPNARLNLYILFARQRMDQLQQLLAKDKKGRSLTARELLDDYTRIIDAIDNVSNDALKRKADLAVGTSAVNTAEKKFLVQLEKIRDGAPVDLGQYEVALREAIETTSDSMELAQGDLTKRGDDLKAEAEQEKKKVSDMIAAEDSKGKVTEAVAADLPKTEDAKPKRKPPTLLRPGEKPTEPRQ